MKKLIVAFLLTSSRALAQEEPDAPPVVVPVPPPTAAPAPPPPPAPAQILLLVLPTPRLPPFAHAAPATEAATRGAGPIRAGLEVFASYTYQNLDTQQGRSWFHVFDLPRAHAALEGEMDRVKGRVVLEATRSAANGALTGVAGDSFVLRIREAYAAYRPIDMLEVSGGVIPTATIPELDGTWMMRAVAPSALESSGLASPADLGARVRLDLPKDFGFVSTSVYNGEGYDNRELNRGKNTEFAADIHPIPIPALRPLGVFGSYVAGSAGTSKARADRVTGGLVWQDVKVRAGAFATYAWGVRDAATQHATVASLFVRVEPIPRVLLGARFDHFLRDAKAVPDDRVSTFTLTGGYRIADPLEGFLVLRRTIPTTRAQAELPGSNTYELQAVARVVF